MRSTEPITASPPPPLDVMHDKLSGAFVSPIAWFDRLFFDERDEIDTNSSYLRVITGTDWVDGEGFRFRSRVRAKVRVPGLKQRINLLLSDEEDEAERRGRVASSQRTTFNQTRAVTRLDRNARGNQSRAGVGVGVLRGFDTDVDVETLLRSKNRFEADVRIRQKVPTWEKIKTRGSLTGFWLQKTGFGSRLRLNAERPFSKRTLLHWDNAVTQIHRINGVVGDSRISYDIQISEKAGISPSVAVSGVTRPVWRIETYQTTLLYRQAFFRDWLFYELEPGANWSRDEFGAHPGIMTCAFRIEVQFRETSD